MDIPKDIKRPKFCVIEVSHRCMFRCKMCNYGMSPKDPEELEIRDLYRFVSSLKEFAGMPFEMNISGGETLMKEGILDLVEFIAAQGFRFSMVTNGFLIDKAVAKRIADSGLSFLAISLDSLDPAIHDFLRGIPGAHKKVMEALEYFIAYRGRLQNLTLQTILMGPNLDGILDLVHWAKDRPLSFSFIAITRPNMVPPGVAWYKTEDHKFLWPQDTARVHHVLDELIRLKKEGHRIDNHIGQLEKFKLYFSDPERFVKDSACSLGDDMMFVNPKGDAYLCCEMESVGNIKESTAEQLWTSQKAENIREKIRRCRTNCTGMVNCYKE
jgi:MoaA/NifB/PqqE/SkfB family radical SAM enzyme